MVVAVDDSLFGTDYSSKGEITSSGDISLVTGLENAKQNIHNWLGTDKGFYPSIDSEYGSLISEALGNDTNQVNIDTIMIYIENALLENPRVQNILSINPYTTIQDTLLFKIEVELVNGQNDTFTIDINGE